MKKFGIFLLTSLLILSACTNTAQNSEEPELEFYAPMKTSLENEVEIDLQMVASQADFVADPEFDGRMKIYDSNKELRAEAVMNENPFMKKGETYLIMTWKGFLEPGDYVLEWFSGKYGGTQIEFEVDELGSGIFSIGEQIIRQIPTD